VDVEEFLRLSGPVLSSDQVGKSVLEIAGAGRREAGAYLLTSAGLSPLN
jgi:hypothetical protein